MLERGAPMTPPPDPSVLWSAELPDGSARAEILLHATGWECRVTRQGRLHRSWIHADVRDAHHDATQALLELGLSGGPTRS
jgi:hypothetical protein